MIKRLLLPALIGATPERGHWLTLDNRHMVLVEDHDVRRYRPIFLIDRDGVKAYSDAPSTFEASRGYERAIGQIRR